MRPFSSTELLEVWERGHGSSLVSKAVDMLQAAHPELGATAIAQLPIGARDRKLFEVRSRNFGSDLLALARCDACGERVESTLDLSALAALGSPASATFEVQSGEAHVEFRLPCSLDLAAALGSRPELARSTLLERCIVTISTASGTTELSQPILAAVAAEMERLDPASDIRLAMTCVCGCTFAATFDIVAYLWREIDVAARRLLEEIHTLASCYGWSEREILGLSPTRRQAYLEMVSR